MKFFHVSQSTKVLCQTGYIYSTFNVVWLTEQVETWEWFKLMFIDVGSRISWDGAIDRLAGAASKILPSSNLLHKAVNFMIFMSFMT